MPRIAAILLAAALVALLAACSTAPAEGPEPAQASPEPAQAEPDGAAPAAQRAQAVVAAVVDGDTIELAGGRRVRLLQIDTPELGEGECYSRKAALVLRSLLPPNARVRLERDPSLDRVDRYGRLLRYVYRGGVNLNVALVERGAASVWFYDGERGRYAARLLTAARAAKADRRGLWSACPGTNLDPTGSVETRRGAAPQQNNPAHCDPSYPDVCIPSPPPDLDCGDLPYRGIRVVGADPHRLDGWDDDGVGCER